MIAQYRQQSRNSFGTGTPIQSDTNGQCPDGLPRSQVLAIATDTASSADVKSRTGKDLGGSCNQGARYP